MLLKHNYIKIFLGLGIINLIILLFFFFKTIPEYGSTDRDESPYIYAAKNFANTNYFGSAAMINEKVARKGEADWYGVFYPILYGGLMKILSAENTTYIAINLFFFSLSFFLIIISKRFNTQIKISFIALLLLFPTFLQYTFSLMPIALNAFFVIAILILLTALYSNYSPRKLIILVSLILIATLFRPTFVFLLFTILPLFTKRKQLVLVFSLVLIAIVLTNVYTAIFTAPPNFQRLKITDFLFQLKFAEFFQGIYSAFINNIMVGPANYNGMHFFEFFTYYFTLLSPVYFLITAYKKNNLVFAIALGCLATNMALTFLYTLYPHFYIRISVPVSLLMFYCLVISEFKRKYVLIFVFTILTISALKYDSYQIKGFEARKESFVEGEALKKELKIVNTFLENRNGLKDPITVLIDFPVYNSYPPHVLFAALPHSTNDNIAIRYTRNNKENSLTLHKKIPVSFILTSDSLLEKSPFNKVASTAGVYLYEVSTNM